MMVETIDAVLATNVDLASPRLGTKVVVASDEFFGAKERLIQEAEPVFIADRYDINGKWMDGWETRRRRGLGHDWCVLRLGMPGRLAFADIDTRFFTGNYPPSASLEGSVDEDETPPGDHRWRPLLPCTALGPGRQHLLPINDHAPVRWVRLSIFPDGGVARLRLYGLPVIDRARLADGEVELSALRYGGLVVGYSDAHYGKPWIILSEGRGRDMGDGWETRRRREPGHDWIIVKLGVPGEISRLEIDTAHFKGNFPDQVSVQACSMPDAMPDTIICQSMFWPELLTPQPARADAIHHFDRAMLAKLGPVTHVRINMHPHGGISRFRAFGRPA